MNASIQVIDPGLGIQLAFETSGLVGTFLDLDEQFKVRLTKSLEELTEAQKIRQQAALSQSVPGTYKNRLMLEQYFPHAYDKVTSSIRVEVRHKGRVVEVDRLVVIDIKDSSNRIEIELFGGGWITDLEDINLNEIELPSFEYTKANVESTWVDTTALAVAMLADYGGWNTPGDVTRLDLRFVFNLFKLMDKALCQFGWEFKSPYFESLAGASQYGYLSDSKWFSYEDKNDQFRIETNIQPRRMLSGAPSVLFDEISDPFDLYNGFFAPGAALYPPAGEPNLEYRIRITNMQVTLKPHPVGSSGEWFMLVSKGDFSVFLDLEIRQGRPDQDVVFTIDKTITDPDCVPGTKYTFTFAYQEPDNSPLDWEIECDAITYIPDPFFLIPDDTIPLSESLSDSIPASELYKAMSQLISGKTETDFVNKRVTLFSPFDNQQLGESINGFFERNQSPVDLTEFVQANSMEVKYKGNEQNRFIELKFADSSDKYIEDESPNPQLYGRTIDNGFGKAGSTKIENPLFEPTNERPVDPALTGSTTSLGPTLPHLWDNTEGKISFDLGSRIFYHYGLVEHQDPATAPAPVDLMWEGGTITEFGYLSQVGSAPIISDPERVPIAFAEFSKDLYRMHYRKWLREQFAETEISFLIWMDYERYCQITFRRPIAIFYRHTFLKYQLLAVRDFDMDMNISTPIEVVQINC